MTENNFFLRHIATIAGVIIIISNIVFYVLDIKLPDGIPISIMVIYASIIANRSINTNREINTIKNWLDVIEPTILTNVYKNHVSSETEFYAMLRNIMSRNNDSIKKMIDGQFPISSDVFTDYWIPLLKKPTVKFYHSTALIENENYFEENQLSEMIDHNIAISKQKKVTLLFFVSDEILKDATKRSEIKEIKDKLLASGHRENLIIKIAPLSYLTDRCRKDFGIAGNLAFAVLESSSIVDPGF